MVQQTATQGADCEPAFRIPDGGGRPFTAAWKEGAEVGADVAPDLLAPSQAAKCYRKGSGPGAVIRRPHVERRSPCLIMTPNMVFPWPRVGRWLGGFGLLAAPLLNPGAGLGAKPDAETETLPWPRHMVLTLPARVAAVDAVFASLPAGRVNWSWDGCKPPCWFAHVSLQVRAFRVRLPARFPGLRRMAAPARR